MENIKIKHIRTGDLLFLNGLSQIAWQIKDAQKAKNLKNWHLNHVGVFMLNNDILCVAEADNPGKFDINVFHEQYWKTHQSVLVGRVKGKKLTEEEQHRLSYDMIVRASDNRFTNYAYLDLLSFKANSLIYKHTGKDVWIGRKKNKRDRYTCSQITAKYLQDYFGILTHKSHIEFMPAEIADSKEIELFKIID